MKGMCGGHGIRSSAFNIQHSTFSIQHSTFSLLPSAFSLLPSAFSLLPSAFILLPSSFCLLPSAFCIPPSSLLPQPVPCQPAVQRGPAQAQRLGHARDVAVVVAHALHDHLALDLVERHRAGL